MLTAIIGPTILVTQEIRKEAMMSQESSPVRRRKGRAAPPRGGGAALPQPGSCSEAQGEEAPVIVIHYVHDWRGIAPGGTNEGQADNPDRPRHPGPGPVPSRARQPRIVYVNDWRDRGGEGEQEGRNEQ